MLPTFYVRYVAGAIFSFFVVFDIAVGLSFGKNETSKLFKNERARAGKKLFVCPLRTQIRRLKTQCVLVNCQQGYFYQFVYNYYHYYLKTLQPGLYLHLKLITGWMMQ